MTQEEILYQLRCIATADVTRALILKDGTLEVNDTDSLDEDLRAAIASVEKGSSGIKVKFYDKLKALELLGKHVGLFDGAGGVREESPLLQALLEQKGEELELDDIPEAEQAAAACHDLVEQAELKTP